MSAPNPLVILEPETTRVALTTRSDYRYTGRYGSTQTVYGYVHKVISHPFRDGDTVRYGTGRTPWTVESVSLQHVSMISPKGIRRVLTHDSLTLLTLVAQGSSDRSQEALV